MSNSPLLIGITGGIGSGKSLVCKLFSLLGAPVYYADDRAKWLSNHDLDIKQKILSEFGAKAYNEDGLNRKYMAQTVFGDKQKLQTLNSIVHPVVGADFRSWAAKQKFPYALKEAALMFESGSYKSLDKVVNVSAPVQVRIDRVLKRDTFRTAEDVRNIIEKQLSEEERSRRSDFIIHNDGSAMVIPQVLDLDKKFRSLAV